MNKLRILKSYKFILPITLIIIFMSLFSILYFEKTKLPNENWSNSIALNSYSLNDNYDNFNNKDIEFILINNDYYLFYFSKNFIFINIYDENMNLIANKKIDKQFEYINNLEVSLSEDNIKLLFEENKILNELLIDKNGNIINDKNLYSNVENISIIENDILYYKDNYIFLNDKKIKKIDHLIKSSFFKFNNSYYISYINFNNYKYELHYIEIFNNEIKNDEFIKTFTFDSVTNIFSFDSNRIKNNFDNIIVVYNSKFGVFSNYYLSLDENLNIKEYKNYFSSGYNLKYLNDGEYFIQNEDTNIGKIDISTKNKTFPNIVKFSDDNKISLTKTKKFPNKIKYYTFNDNEYLLFSEKNCDSKLSTFISSTNKNLIKISKKLTFNDYKNLFFTTFTTFLPLFLYGLIYSVLFLIPIFVIVLPLSLFRITWAEQNQNKLLILSISLYLLSKLKYILFNVTLTDLPIIFTNPFLRVFSILILSSISIYSMCDISKNKNLHFFKKFVIFFIIDIVLFTLFFTPYLLV